MIRKYGPYVLTVLCVIAGYMVFDWAMGAVIHSRKVVVVPDLSSKAVNDALNILSPLGLGLEKEGEQFDKRFPAGAIVHQTPSPGMPVREGRIVREGTPAELTGDTSETEVRYRRNGQEVVLRTTEPTKLLHELTSRAIEAGHELEGLEVRRASLEDVYLSLTKEEEAE